MRVAVALCQHLSPSQLGIPPHIYPCLQHLQLILMCKETPWYSWCTVSGPMQGHPRVLLFSVYERGCCMSKLPSSAMQEGSYVSGQDGIPSQKTLLLTRSVTKTLCHSRDLFAWEYIPLRLLAVNILALDWAYHAGQLQSRKQLKQRLPTHAHHRPQEPSPSPLPAHPYDSADHQAVPLHHSVQHKFLLYIVSDHCRTLWYMVA